MNNVDNLLGRLITLFKESKSASEAANSGGLVGWAKEQFANLQKYEELAKGNVIKLNDPNVSVGEKKEIKDWFYNTYTDFVEDRAERFIRSKTPEFVRGGEVDEDLRDEITSKIWESFLLAKGKPGILSYNPSKGDFLGYLNVYISSIFSSGRSIFDFIHKGTVADLGLGNKDNDDDAGSGGSFPDPKASQASRVEQLSIDEKDIAKDVVKGLERIVKSGNTEGGISPEKAELFMQVYALGRPFSKEKLDGLLKNPNVDIAYVKDVIPARAMTLAGVTGERKKIFQLLLSRIDKLVTGGKKVSGKERNVPDLLTLPTAPMEESIIRLVELLKEWNNVNANVERSA
jgi:hypothetical protein